MDSVGISGLKKEKEKKKKAETKELAQRKGNQQETSQFTSQKVPELGEKTGQNKRKCI